MPQTPESRARQLARDQKQLGESAPQRLRALVERTLPPMVRPTRLAWLLDMPRQRIYELLEMQELDAVRVGKRAVRIPRDSILRWLERCENTQR